MQLHYQSRQPRRIVVGPLLLTLACCCLLAGIYGYLRDQIA